MRFEIGEETPLARLLHRAWQDRAGHGKTIQGVAYPVASTGVHSGSSWGVGVGVVDATREGIGTAAVNVQALHNEHVGEMVTLDALSCPAAFHNWGRVDDAPDRRQAESGGDRQRELADRLARRAASGATSTPRPCEPVELRVAAPDPYDRT